MLLLAGVAVVFVCGFFAVRAYEQHREELTIKSNIYEKNTLFDRILRFESASLELFAYDFSNRDDVLGIVATVWGNPAVRQLEQSMPSFNVSALWIYDPWLKLVYMSNPIGIAGIEQFKSSGTALEELFSRSYFCHFFMDGPAGLVEFRIAPLQPSEDFLRMSPPRGFLVAARLWSDAYVHDLEVLTDCNISFDLINAEETLETSNYDLRSGTVQFSRVLYGWDKKPLRKIQVRSRIPLAREIRLAARRQLIFMMTFFGVIIAVLSALLILWINVPLKRISASLHHENGALLKDLPEAGTEFGNLARLILHFFRQREELQQEVFERSRAQEALKEALDESRRREAEAGALLAAARAVLEHHDFRNAAASILGLAIQLSGAATGFIAEVDPQLKLLRLLCSSQPDFAEQATTMPLQGIYAEAFTRAAPCFRNKPLQSLSAQHERIENIICVPLLVERTPEAMLVLANKSGGFSENDLKMAAAFSELASVALLNSRTLESLEVSEERFRSVVATAQDAIITVTHDDRIVFWNQGAERMFGYRADEVLDRRATMLLPERLRTFYETQTAVVSEEAFVSREMIGRRRDGSEFPMELSRSSWKTKDGTFYTAIIRDISERKQSEQKLRESEQRMRMQDKMASLGRIAAGIAHEIRNPLTGITTHIYMLQRCADATDVSPKHRQQLQEIIEALQFASDRIESVIRRVMDFSKPSAPQLSPINLNDAIKTAIDLAATTLRKSAITLQTDLLPDLAPCLADRSLIEQALVNLLTNAAEALHTWQGRKIIALQTRMDQGSVVIVVGDSGPGIAPENMTKIFDPFFTTKSDGSGIGLSICQRIITDHRGSLSVGTSPLGGAEFIITLPVSREPSDIGRRAAV